MTTYIPRLNIVQAEQLRWDNWGAVCTMLEGSMGSDKIHGVAVSDKGIVREQQDAEASHIGLWIPSTDGKAPYIVFENQYVIRDIQGQVYGCSPELFDKFYEKTDGYK